MGSIWVSGDCHADYSRFSKHEFPMQQHMNRDDYMIICGDFGIWHDCNAERYNLDELNNRNFTTLFVDGNHESFDRLCTEEYRKYMAGEDITGADQGEFPLVDMFGGKVQQIRPNIFHLLRGEVYEICGKKIFTFGGASSHDIDDGILDRANYDSDDAFYLDCYMYRKAHKMFRIAHESWWKEELPNEDEMRHGMENLAKHDFQVDYIITHCLPSRIAAMLGYYGQDTATEYLQQVFSKTQFKKYFCGHYHQNEHIPPDIFMMYNKIMLVYDSI